MTDFQKEEDKALMFYALSVLDNEQIDITQNALTYSLFCKDGFVAYELFDCIRKRAQSREEAFESGQEYLVSLNLLHKVADLSEQKDQAMNVKRILDFFESHAEALDELIDDFQTGKFINTDDDVQY